MTGWRGLALVAAVLAGLAACGPAPSSTTRRRSAAPAAPIDKKVGAVQHGKATWYGGRFHGRKTASGEIFDENALTAAHRTLPFQSVVRVKNLKNGRTVDVRITDRGPYAKGRIVDLSRAAAVRLDMIRDGVIPVRLQVLKLGEHKARRRR